MEATKREISSWFVWQGEQSPYELKLKEGAFETHLETIFVIHKRQLKQIRPQEIGDGMLVIHTSTAIDPQIDLASVRSWTCVYSRFDEQLGEKKFFAYKFDRSKIDRCNAVFENLWLNLLLEGEKFVKIKHWSYELQQLQDLDVSQTLSFLLWIALIYGKFSFQDEVLQHVVIQIPLVESIALIEDELLSMIQGCFERSLFLTYDYIDQKHGQVLQINIADESVLGVRSSWLGGLAMDHSMHTDELAQHGIDLSDKVLKLLHK